jgi:hypothetical protein
MKDAIYNVLNDPKIYRAEPSEVIDQFKIMVKRAKMSPPCSKETEFPIDSKIMNTP